LRVEKFARCCEVAGLTALSLKDIDPGDVETLVTSPHFRSLKRLSLRSSQLGAEWMASLAKAPLLGQLSDLDLYEADIGLEGLRTLLTSPLVAGLMNLELHGVLDLGADGGHAFASSMHLRRLVGLSLYWAGLGPEGVAEVRWWSSDELSTATEQFAPPDLPERVRRLT
jgi:hypothetical protein